MKKRMFITTIVMMLVLAVALTTSSLAWFSAANANVTASAATFVAQTKTGSQSLKISNSASGTWTDSIDLYKAANESTTIDSLLVPLVPKQALVSEYQANYAWKGDGVVKQLAGGATEVRQQEIDFQNYVWPTKIDFNGAKIDANGNFIIDEGSNAVVTKTIASYGNAAGDGFFYKSFFIKNADLDTTINGLSFEVKVDMTATSPDYTANGVAAFIIYDQLGTAVGQTVPANVIDDNGKEYGGHTVQAYAANPEDDEPYAIAAGDKYYAWRPFAAFTFNTSKGYGDTISAEENWQFATLAAGTHNGTAPSALKTQAADAATNKSDWDGASTAVDPEPENNLDAEVTTNSFTLNTASMKILNNKTVTTGNVIARTENTDNASKFEMIPGEVYRLDFYYWLDGKTLKEETDTTSSTITLSIGIAG